MLLRFGNFESTVKSDGFWCPLSYLKFTGINLNKLQEGYEFDTINGFPICKKYYTKATYQKIKNKTKENRKETPTFPMHIETKQYKNYINIINIDDVNSLTITEKLHGTSQRFGFTLDNIPLLKWQKIFNKISPIKIKENKKAYTHMMGTRRVILRNKNEKSFYVDESFRENVCHNLYGKLRKGEIIFFEIVGWAKIGVPIMNFQSTLSLKDKEFTKKYGEKMIYSYGCNEGEHKAYVYRIVLVNEDGFLIDYNWELVKQRCKELEINHVPELMSYYDIVNSSINIQENIENLISGPSVLDNSHIREGVVLRIDNKYGTDFFKHKSFEFGILEGYLKNDDNYVDIEEIS